MMLQDRPVAWLLDDQRIGNLNQLKAITYYLKDKLDVREYEISFNHMISLPNMINFLLGTGIDIDPSNLSKKPAPYFILSAGRRSALAALKLKKIYPDAKIIQIMRPNLPAKCFDFIITPKHDNYTNSTIETTLTPNFINQDTLKKASGEWQKEFSDIKEPILAVIIGGDTKHNKVPDDTIIKLCNDLLKLKSKSGCHICITTSRRTSNSNIKYIKNILDGEASLYLWGLNSKRNPYLAMLSYSHSIMVSADSISMVSDGLATGKPIYILEEDFGNKKHHDFIEHLKQQKLVSSADMLFQDGLKDNGYPPINDAKKISDAIVQHFELKQ